MKTLAVCVKDLSATNAGTRSIHVHTARRNIVANVSKLWIAISAVGLGALRRYYYAKRAMRLVRNWWDAFPPAPRLGMMAGNVYGRNGGKWMFDASVFFQGRSEIINQHGTRSGTETWTKKDFRNDNEKNHITSKGFVSQISKAFRWSIYIKELLRYICIRVINFIFLSSFYWKFLEEAKMCEIFQDIFDSIVPESLHWQLKRVILPAMIISHWWQGFTENCVNS